MSELRECRHLGVSEEAYQVDAVTGRSAPALVHLCCFVDNEPGRFVDMPRWLVNAVYGRAIRPELDCAGCAAYRALQAQEPK